MSDKELLSELRQGNMSAFAELVRSHKAQVIATCYRFLLDKQDAEDLAQEVFIEVFENVNRFRGDAKLSTWIYRIAVTRCLDELKKRSRKKRFGSVTAFLGWKDVEELYPAGTQPDHLLEHHEQQALLQKAMQALPENQRVAFTLSKVDGYDNHRIADIMQTTVMSVESLISRAKRALLAALERLQKEE